MAPSCLINTYKDVHASKEGLTTSKVKKEIPPPWPPKLGHCAQWPSRGVLGKKIRPTFFCLNLMYISQLTMSRSILMSGLVKVPFLGTRKWSEIAFYTINLREWISFETLKNAQLVL